MSIIDIIKQVEENTDRDWNDSVIYFNEFSMRYAGKYMKQHKSIVTFRKARDNCFERYIKRYIK